MKAILSWFRRRSRPAVTRDTALIEGIAWDAFQDLLQYRIRDRSLFATALRHSSHESVEQRAAESYERLEFLGDAILDMGVAYFLYQAYPSANEGDLTQMRSRLVSQRALAHCARRLQLGRYIVLGPGEIKTGGHQKDSILSDSVEAIIGALYLDGGEQAAHAFIQRAIMDDIDALLTMVQSRNFKGELLEYCQRKFHTTPRYELRGQEGLAHSKTYTMDVRVNGEIFGDGVGSSKKEAEQRAAEKALDTIGGHYPR